ncbi:MAG: molecular chaperone TorD family protein [Ancrocorticia sp.]
MSINQANFDPTKAPAREDVVSCGVRLGTAATVIASFYASAPTTGMIDNFFNPELLAVWPLRDEVSLSGTNHLLAGHDHQGELRSDWLSLYGYDAVARPTETQRGTAPEVQQELGELYSRENFSNIQVHNAPADHIAAELAFSGHLATRAAMSWREGTSLAPLGEQLREFLRDHLGPLAQGVVVDAEKHATTVTYRALVPLTRGYLAELADFADYLAEGD